MNSRSSWTNTTVTPTVEITNPAYLLPTESATFDGRDVFAPAAAHLCLGVDLAELGPPIDPISLFPAMVPLTREEDGRLHAEVLWVDRYGNLQLNVSRGSRVAAGDKLRIGRHGDRCHRARQALRKGLLACIELPDAERSIVAAGEDLVRRSQQRQGIDRTAVTGNLTDRGGRGGIRLRQRPHAKQVVGMTRDDLRSVGVQDECSDRSGRRLRDKRRSQHRCEMTACQHARLSVAEHGSGSVTGQTR